MAVLKVYVVYDSKVGAYDKPFFMRSNGECLRGWETVCNDGKSMMSLYPTDYTLFESGEYDESTGRVNQYDALRPLSTALEAKKSESMPEIRKVQG